jgi:glyoxylase-like metal-dependent hydrolase (beta-lactamase superfamily II)
LRVTSDKYILDPDVERVRSQGITVTRGLMDGEIVDVMGTPVEVFAIPGHTPGSAAYVVHGVLFLGDSPAMDEKTMAPSAFVNDDSAPNQMSLRNLAERLMDRRTSLRQIAFGHHGRSAVWIRC